MSPDTKLQLFYSILLIRRVEEAIAALYSDQEMRCPVHLSIGQEAIASGVCAQSQPGDIVFSGHRSHAHYIAQGGDLNRFFAELYGKETGCSQGLGGSMHLIDLSVGFYGAVPIVGSTIPISVGTAFGNVLQKKKGVSVCFFGEGATEEGVFHESLQFAALHKLPVIFICENNFFSVYSPLSVRQPSERNLIQMAESHGLYAEAGSGNCAETVYKKTQKALEHTRAGNGPCLLEFDTYRWLEHCGPNYDNHIGYRTEEEFLEWKKKCPLSLYQKQLEKESILTQDILDSYESQIKERIESAIAYAQNSDALKTGSLSELNYDNT